MQGTFSSTIIHFRFQHVISQGSIVSEADRCADMTVLLRSHAVKTAVDCRENVPGTSVCKVNVRRASLGLANIQCKFSVLQQEDGTTHLQTQVTLPH